jgi:hypothetical protein
MVIRTNPLTKVVNKVSLYHSIDPPLPYHNLTHFLGSFFEHLRESFLQLVSGMYLEPFFVDRSLNLCYWNIP